jgi:hypothetical protein
MFGGRADWRHGHTGQSSIVTAGHGGCCMCGGGRLDAEDGEEGREDGGVMV